MTLWDRLVGEERVLGGEDGDNNGEKEDATDHWTALLGKATGMGSTAPSPTSLIQSSLPAPGQHRLHVLRPLIDGLIPAKTRLLREARHRLDQLLHLGIE